MKRFAWVPAVWLAAVPFLASAEKTMPFANGERLDYEVSLLGLKAGEAKLHVEENGDGWRFFATGRTVGPSDSLFGLRQSASCTVDADDLQPRLCLNNTTSRGSQRRKEVRFDEAAGVVRERTLEGGKRNERAHQFTDGMADVQDALSALYLLRRDLPAAGAEALRFRSMRKGKPISVAALHLGEEEVKTAAGTFMASVIDLQISEKIDDDPTHAKLWFSADARRLPLKIVIDAPVGSLRAELTSARGTVEQPLAGR